MFCLGQGCAKLWSLQRPPPQHDLRSLKFRDAENGLHETADVTAVTQVSHASVAWAVHRLQLQTRFLDHFPFGDPGLYVIIPQAVLCLNARKVIKNKQTNDAQIHISKPSFFF